MDISNLSLAEVITQFRNDTVLAHEFVNGDETTIVNGEGGSYPSLAKIAADADNRIVELYNNQTQGLLVKHYQFQSTLDLVIEHNLNTRVFDLIIINSEGMRVHAPIDVVNENEFIVRFTEPEAGIVTASFYVIPI